MAQPLGDTAADEDLVGAAVDDAIQLAMVVTLTGREAVFSELVRAACGAGCGSRAAIRRPPTTRSA